MDKKELGATSNEKIENLNLVALRKYACPKISNQKDWYLKCVDCKGLDGCPAGKRAMAILEEQTRSEKPGPIIVHMTKDKRHEKLIEALKTKDPAQYLLDLGFYGGVRWRADEAVRKFKSRWNIPETGPYSIVIDDHQGCLNPGYLKQQKIAREKVSQLMAGVETDRQLLDVLVREEPGTLVSTLNSRLYDWNRHYPDLCGNKKNVILGAARKLAAVSRRRSGESVTFAEAYKEMFGDIPPATDDEEVSVEDFLKETAEATPEPEEDTKQDVPPEKPVKVISCDMAKREQEEKDIMLKQFSKKRKMIKASLIILDENMAKIQEAIEGIRVKKAILNRQLELLDETARMFGMFPEGDPLAV